MPIKEKMAAWMKVESLMFCVTELAKSLNPQELHCIKEVVGMIPHLPNDFTALRL